MGKHFEGTVKVYDEEIHINTTTKKGYERVLQRIDPLLCKMASKTYMPGYIFEDIKQELTIMAIEGVNAYDPKKNVKLSTFLHIHLRNKLVSKIRSANKLSNDASSGGNLPAIIRCHCGNSIQIDKENLPEDNIIDCDSCGKKHNQTYRKSREEILFSSIPKVDLQSGEEYGEFQNSLSNSDGLFSDNVEEYGGSNLTMAMKKLIDSVDEKTGVILSMVLSGYSIKDAAKEVGLTGWAASMRLKKLSRNRIIKEMLKDSLG